MIWEFEKDELSLFNLKEDIGEQTNLAVRNPEKRTELYRKLKEWLEATNASMPLRNPDFNISNNN